MTISRLPLADWPTPVEPAPRLARALGLEPDDLWIKRDDLTGLGGGGNKIRKLEHTVAQALAAGADTLVTTGAPQSNHARLTAAAAARAGLSAVLVFPGEPGGSGGAEGSGGSGGGNLVLDGLLGARAVWAGDVDQDGLAAAAARLAASLPAAALIPFGGSSVVGARGYVEGGHELLGQVPDLDTVVVALGSGGTMAGLVAALGPDKVLGVHTGAVDDPRTVVSDLVSGLTGLPPDPGALRIRDDQVGPGYAVQTDAVVTAMETAARTEGIVLDPVYTGRALAGLAAAVADGTVRRNRRTVFLHTGGLPGLFGHPSVARRWHGPQVLT
ncbi:pyridoxal-phosphate dependent enzyme [Streptomyces sp. MMBL 11-3]|uniref:pyridoxal-phosphate dependent enzyme n=1 Tax=Streptomyces sp. MMBL 11-3 TaxID=3382639 RepID=UPI0039B4F098